MITEFRRRRIRNRQLLLALAGLLVAAVASVVVGLLWALGWALGVW